MLEKIGYHQDKIKVPILVWF